MESEVSQAVGITLVGEWQSGPSQMHVTLTFFAPSLDEALALIKRATDGAPSFKNPLEEGQH